MTDLDADLLATMTAELLARNDCPLEVMLRPVSALHLAGLLQLALRHPSIAADSAAAQMAERFIASLRTYFADAPATLEVLRRGAVPAFDDGSPRVTLQ